MGERRLAGIRTSPLPISLLAHMCQLLFLMPISRSPSLAERCPSAAALPSKGGRYRGALVGVFSSPSFPLTAARLIGTFTMPMLLLRFTRWVNCLCQPRPLPFSDRFSWKAYSRSTTNLGSPCLCTRDLVTRLTSPPGFRFMPKYPF